MHLKKVVVDELNKIVLSPKPSVSFDLLEPLGLSADFANLLFALKGVETKEGIGHNTLMAKNTPELPQIDFPTDEPP